MKIKLLDFTIELPTQLRKIYERESNFEVCLEIPVDVLQVPDTVQFFCMGKGTNSIIEFLHPHML